MPPSANHATPHKLGVILTMVGHVWEESHGHRSGTRGGVDLARDTFDAEAWLVAAPAEPWLEGLPTEVCTEPWTEEADLMPGLEAREEDEGKG